MGIITQIIQRVGSYMTTKLSKSEKNAQTAVIRLPKTLPDDELSKGKGIIELTLCLYSHLQTYVRRIDLL